MKKCINCKKEHNRDDGCCSDICNAELQKDAVDVTCPLCGSKELGVYKDTIGCLDCGHTWDVKCN